MTIRAYSLSKLSIFTGLIISLVLGYVPVSYAQLEEIVVTAQRREQSLQDVPVSLQTFSGDDMTRQGFDTLNELTTFAPGLVVKAWSEEQGLILRGAGTQSKNLGIEQGVPTFIDGIHMGRGSQVLNSYLDIERVEVLKGPQPVFFGQNAAAGALNIETRKPGDEWEGSVTGDFGNFGKAAVEGAFGGPVTDTFGIRVAAKYYRLEGFMRDYFTGEKFPQREYKTIRFTTQWAPMENFEATWKFEYSDNDLGPRVQPIVLEKTGNLDDAKLTHGLRVPITGILTADVPPLDQAVGEFTNVGILYKTFLNPRAESMLSLEQGLPPLTEASGSNSGVVLDFTQCAREGGLQVFRGGDALTGGGSVVGPVGGGIEPVLGRYDRCQMQDVSGSKPWHAIMDLTYTFGNGIELTSKTGFSRQEFWNSPYNSGGGPFITNARQRGEFFGQWSEELRVSSPVGGDIEWMAGLYWQKNELDAWSDAYRANSRNPIRSTRTFEDAEWLSGFVSLTYNFFDNRASVDLGARYTDISKRGGGQNRIAEYIVEDPDTGDLFQLPYGMDNTDSNAGRDAATGAFLTANPGLVNASIVGRTLITDKCDALLGRNDPLGRGNIGDQRCVSQDLKYGESCDNCKTDSFDPQIVFRYRPSDDMSLYAKYATSFKSGGYDMGVSELPLRPEDFSYGPEDYKIYEIGLRGTFMDGRLAAEATVFATDIKGTQVSFVDRSEGRDRNVTQNVGAQKSDGIEISLKYAASDRLTVGGYFALLDGVIIDFTTSVCTDDDRVAGRCVDRDGNPALGSTPGAADRSGQEARNAPNWQFTGNARYELPTILEGYWSNFDVTLTGTSAYTTDRSFSNVYSYDSAWDTNLSYEFGGDDNRWSVLLYGRNLLAAKPVYHPELDFAGEGVSESSAQVTLSNYTSYGARLRYNFF